MTPAGDYRPTGPIAGSIIPMKRDVATMLEDATRTARIDTAEQAATIAQMWQPGALFEDADPRTIALIKQEIGDAIRKQLGQFNPPAAA